MNIKPVYLLFILGCSLCVLDARAQGAYEFGLLPAVNVNRTFKQHWSVNSKLESRQLLQQGYVEGQVSRAYDYLLTDLSVIVGRKVGLDSRLAGGYLMRFEDGAVAHRFIQQYIHMQRFSGFRLAHRFLSDQTVSRTEETEYRLRYRMSAEIPLDGKAVDAGEFYLKLNNEYVNSLQASLYDLQIRLVPLLGYDLTDRFKIEAGLDYRVDGFLNNTITQDLWMTLNVFIEV